MHNAENNMKACSQGSSANPEQGNVGAISARTHFYAIEYNRPMKNSGDLRVLGFEFFIKVSPQQAEEIVRSELDRIKKYFAPTGKVMAMAYFYPDDAHEEQITFPDGSTSIIYSPTTGLTLTSKAEARSKMAPTKASEQINVTMDVKIETDSAGRVRVKGISNLPLDIALMISLKNTGSNYSAQDKALVLNDGSFSSQWFTDHNARVPAGVYLITVTSPVPLVQPASVKKIIGERGEHLSGKLVALSNFGGNCVEFSKKVNIK